SVGAVRRPGRRGARRRSEPRQAGGAPHAEGQRVSPRRGRTLGAPDRRRRGIRRSARSRPRACARGRSRRIRDEGGRRTRLRGRLRRRLRDRPGSDGSPEGRTPIVVSQTRVAVDIGGTFTDLVHFDAEAGAVGVAKAATTPGRFEDGVMDALGDADLDGAAFVAHGTTVIINALTERTGATTALITTRGFRDVLEIQRAN